jgi:hypothetical protein
MYSVSSRAHKIRDVNKAKAEARRSEARATIFGLEA